jgi:hypothetical protein
MVMRQATNIMWRAMVFGSVAYGCIQLCSYVAGRFRENKENTPTPVAQTIDDTLNEGASGIEYAGRRMSDGARYIMPYIEGIESRFQDGREEAPE